MLRLPAYPLIMVALMALMALRRQPETIASPVAPIGK
jgi:hypothetical protein